MQGCTDPKGVKQCFRIIECGCQSYGKENIPTSDPRSCTFRTRQVSPSGCNVTTYSENNAGRTSYICPYDIISRCPNWLVNLFKVLGRVIRMHRPQELPIHKPRSCELPRTYGMHSCEVQVVLQYNSTRARRVDLSGAGHNLIIMHATLRAAHYLHRNHQGTYCGGAILYVSKLCLQQSWHTNR